MAKSLLFLGLSQPGRNGASEPRLGAPLALNPPILVWISLGQLQLTTFTSYAMGWLVPLTLTE